ncbi:LexA family transcriptional regulator [Tabrizicola thermarum]|uniref:LexA family transcriptional regulator n=1 Tax=Tabrizicola thermarum TaxID=2670345 RepID=UPI00138FE31A|nr:LexA family transcriptional regulator [Tabrizicola thermarum]
MVDEPEIPRRLKAIRERAHLSVRDMASRVGMSTSGYAHYESPSRFKAQYLPMEMAQKVASVFAGNDDVVAELMELAGQPVREGSDKDEYQSQRQSVPAALVPVYNVEVSAGPGRIVDLEEHVANLAFSPRYLAEMTAARGRDLAAIRVRGDSMEPTLLDDDMVMIDRTKTSLDYDGLFVLRFGEALHCKRVGRGRSRTTVQVISDNRIYPPVEMDRSEIEVVGKVLWYGRKV